MKESGGARQPRSVAHAHAVVEGWFVTGAEPGLEEEGLEAVTLPEPPPSGCRAGR